MSYAIIRNEKHKLSNVSNIGRHNERQNKQYGNPNVDTEKSILNYHLKTPVEKSYEKEFERIKKVEHLLGNIRSTGKKQSNAICEFVITSDLSFFEEMTLEEQRRFFNDCYDYVKKRCGEPYVISAVVHMDERTPHMHVAYIPVVDGKDRKGNPCKRVNCSKFWKGYNSYGQLQDEFFKHITARGYKLERGEVGTRAEHVTAIEYRRKCMEKEMHTAEKSLGAAKKRFAALESKAKSMEGALASKKRLDAIKPESGMMGTIKGVSIEDVQNLKKTAMEYYALVEKMRDLSAKYVALKSKVPTEAEKLEVAKKLTSIQQLEAEKKRMETIMRAHGINPSGQAQGNRTQAQR